MFSLENSSELLDQQWPSLSIITIIGPRSGRMSKISRVICSFSAQFGENSQSPISILPSSVFRRPSSVFRRPSSVVRRPSSVVCRPSSVVRLPSSVFRRPSSVFLGIIRLQLFLFMPENETADVNG